MVKYERGKYLFVAPSKHKTKKYDVYNAKTGAHITSFGGIKASGKPYQQFKDAIGHYAKYDHGETARRKLYRVRHAGENEVVESAGWFAWKYLW